MRCRILSIAGLSLATLLSAAVAPGAVHRVGPGESISNALQSARPGDTLLLTGEEYRENLAIDVPVTLKGENQPRILGGYQGNVIYITAPGTVVEGLHISEAGPHLTKDMACVFIEADQVAVRNCTITESLHGIYVKAGNQIEIVGNRIEGRLDLIESDRGNGIHLWNSTDNRIEGNEIFNTRDGIYFSFAHSTEIFDNYIHNVRYGLHYMYSNQNRFRDNVFENNVAGAALMYSEDIVFTRNVFARCRGFRAYGILFQSMSRVEARSNLILDNSRGIFLNNSDNNLIEGNDIVDNDLAIQLNGGCDKNLFVRNNFLNNLSELLLDVSDRETRWSDGQTGNFWTGYRGYDLDRDGIGDVVFNIQDVFQVLESNVPEVRFYLLSPAAEVLDAAERALPILNLGDAVDPHPLMHAAPNTGVPWDRVQSARMEPDPMMALLFLAVAVVPAGAFRFLGR